MLLRTKIIISWLVYKISAKEKKLGEFWRKFWNHFHPQCNNVTHSMFVKIVKTRPLKQHWVVVKKRAIRSYINCNLGFFKLCPNILQLWTFCFLILTPSTKTFQPFPKSSVLIHDQFSTQCFLFIHYQVKSLFI